MNDAVAKPRMSPSAFMRQLRPENYSDTAERASFALDGPTLDHHLETITARNQTHEFEIFCRKLCERTICPHLRPQTGPEGGGDGKVDSETLPVAEEITARTYVGLANAGSEKWGFAFSAKKDWRGKARSDTQGIADINRGHKRIFFVTNQYAKGNTRAYLERDLTNKHGIEVTILDRSWIMKEIIEENRKDLAFNYLHVGQEIADSLRLGPSDYSRVQQLEDIEKSLLDPEYFAGMRIQEVTEALLAAKLSRSLERPRHETDGRFLRAIRLADAHGTGRQQLETRYEHLWTSVWWFDDIDDVSGRYDEFEGRVIETDHATNLEFLSNLLQVLFNAVLLGGYSQEDCQLQARSSRLYARLDDVAANLERPNNALRARTLRLIGQLNCAMLNKDAPQISSLWPEFGNLFEEARGLGEYDAESLINLVEGVGGLTGNDPAYNSLVENMAAFVSERTSEAQGALILLNRAKQLDFDDHFDMIRLLGRAAHQLTKREYISYLIDAMQHLALAYRSAGLLWAARASCVFAGASIIIDGEEDSEIDPGIVPTLTTLAWISLELRHLPDFLEAVQLLNGCLKALPLATSSRERLADCLRELDLALGSRLLNCPPEELNQLQALPDVLEALGLPTARSSLLYALGYVNVLRSDGSIPPEETEEGVATLFTKLASHAVSDDIRGPLIRNAEGSQMLQSTVMGMAVDVTFEGTAISTLLAEAILASIEACFATAFELELHPRTERFEIRVVEDQQAQNPACSVDEINMRATLRWPEGRSPTAYEDSRETINSLIEVAAMTLAASCIMRDAKETIERLASEEAMFERISIIAVTGTSYHRLFSQSPSRLEDRLSQVLQSYPMLPARPKITRVKLPEGKQGSDRDESPKGTAGEPPKLTNHREVEFRSVVDHRLWNRASWKGVLYASYGSGMPPVMALIFSGDPEAAENIFKRWRDRFGENDQLGEIHVAVISDVCADYPAHYSILITSKQRPAEEFGLRNVMMLVRFHRMQPDTDDNLRRFLVDYKKFETYLLMPAVWKYGRPTPMPQLAIVKRNLVVRSAKDLELHDIERCVLGPAVDTYFSQA